MKWKKFFPNVVIIMLAASCSLLPGADESEDPDWDSHPPTGSTPAGDDPVPPSPSTNSDWWQPAVDISWQWQLTGEIDLSFEVDMYDLDLFETDPAVLQKLKDDGHFLVCYISAGSWEDWRPDAGRVPSRDPGEKLPGLARREMAGYPPN